MIQDTSFIIDLLRGDDDALAVLDVFEREARPQKVASITVLELYEGVLQSNTPEDKRATILDILDSKHVLAADARVMRKAGTISGELITEGRRIDREECIIAATVLFEDEAVITRNQQHFERIEGLTVRTY